jgi:hypothetical protein
LIAVGLACLLAGPRRSVGGRLDLLDWVYVLAEAALVVWLSLNSAGGAWVNYAIQAAVFGAVLVGRALARVEAGVSRGWRLAPLWLAVLVVPWGVVQNARGVAFRRFQERELVEKVLNDPRLPPRSRGQRYFVGRPGLNRLQGRLDLTHDEWLYTLFERVRGAESRSTWLRAELTAGPVLQVVTPSDSRTVPGVEQTLPELGYVLIARAGKFWVWDRAPERPPATKR